MGAEPLSAEDLAILELERGPVVGHTVKVIELERPITLSRLRARVAARLHRVPRMRQRLHPVPGGRPLWVDDASFDLRAHVTRARGRLAVEQLAARAFEERLDRARPLWSMELAATGRAVVCRLHHAWADGTTIVRVLEEVLWDHDGDPAPGRPVRWLPAPAPPRRVVAEHAVRGPVARGRGLAAAVARTATDPRRLRVAAAGAAELPGVLARELLPGGGPSPFAETVGPRRAAAFATAPLEELKRAARSVAGHATINDVLLSAVAGGIRAWARGAVPPLRAKVPVSLHRAGGDDAGNRDSEMFVDLDTPEPDPAARLAAIHRETALRKRHHDAQALDALLSDIAHLSRPAERALRRATASSRAFALNVSNVSGPRERPTLLGVRVRALRFLAEIGERHALRVSAVSFAGSMEVGLTADPAAVPRLDALAAATERELRAPLGG